MKTNSLTDTKNSYSSNQALESSKVEIGDAGLILSYMRKEGYKFHLRTAIQEYLSNALDAQREAKQTQKRVKVFAPTIQNPTLIIKDFGVGISPDRMEKIWTKVGVSSKRENNSQKGGFGAGSKTLWAYTDMFLIITVVDGLKYEYEATVAREMGGEVILRSTKKTNEENGTEIHAVIHPNDISKAQNAISRFCFFCEKNEMPEVVNMKVEKTIHDLQKTLIGLSGEEMDSAFIVKTDELPHYTLGTQSHDRCIFVLDGIPYVVDNEYLTTLNKARQMIKGTLIVKFKTGVIKPQLSREGIMIFDQNTKAIESVAKLIEKKIDKEINEMLKDAVDAKTFMKNFTKVLEKYQVQSREFKDYLFSSHFSVTSKKFDLLKFDFRSKNYRGNTRKDEDRKHIDISEQNREYLFWGDTTKESEIKIGRRINEFMLNNNKIHVIKKTENTPDDLFNEILEIFQPKSIHDIEPKEIERQEKEKKIKAAQSFNLHRIFNRGSYSIGKDIINLKEDDVRKYKKLIVHINLDEYSNYRNKDEDQKVFKFYQHRVLFCFIGKEELSRLQKLNLSHVIPYSEFIKNVGEDSEDLLKLMAHKAQNHHYADLFTKIKMDVSLIKNKVLRETLTKYNEIEKNHSISNLTRSELPKIAEKAYQNNKEYKKFLTNDEEFGILFKEKLMMICHTQNNLENYRSKEMTQEVLEYINFKLK